MKHALLKKDGWVRPYLTRFHSQLVQAIFLGLVTFLFASLLMFWSGNLISRTAEMPGGILLAYVPLICVQLFGVGKPVLRYAERLVSHDWVLRMTSDMRRRLYNILERRALTTQASKQTGDVLGILAEDIGHVQNLYLRCIFPIIIGWLLYLVVVIALGFFSVWFALGMALILGVTVFLLPLISLSVNRIRIERGKTLRNNLYAELIDNVLGAKDWIVSGRGKDYLYHHETVQRAARKNQKKLNAYARKNDLILSVVWGLGVCALLIWAATTFGGNGTNVAGGSANWIAAFVLGFFPLLDAFAPLSKAATQTGIYRDSLERLDDLSTLSTSESAKVSHHTPATCSDSPHKPVDTTIALKEVTYSYPNNERPILNGINLTIPPKEKVAILGRSGVGKSTLLSLIRGDSVPTKGCVSIGGIPSADLGDAASTWMSVVSQKTYLFNRTLRANLTLNNPHLTDDEILAALEHVGLTTLVDRLPQKLDTLVDEAGMRFSGGERHRIALARVLLADTPIVLLDEPMVALDPATERGLFDTLLGTMSNKTLIMVTHHLQDIERFERVIFLENGQLSMDGSPSFLEKENEQYRRLRAFDRGLDFEVDA